MIINYTNYKILSLKGEKNMGMKLLSVRKSNQSQKML